MLNVCVCRADIEQEAKLLAVEARRVTGGSGRTTPRNQVWARFN